MTDEEYLRACGWTSGEMSSGKPWWQRAPWCPRLSQIADAVEMQLDEDRARLAFVLARTPQPEPRSCDPGFLVPTKATSLRVETTYTRGDVPPLVSTAKTEPPDSGPVNDLAAVAVRISHHLNHLWFEETGRALALGIQKPGAYAEDGFVHVSYDAFCGVSFILSERVARAYDTWLAAGNVGKHYEGDTLRQGIEVKR